MVWVELFRPVLRQHGGLTGEFAGIFAGNFFMRVVSFGAIEVASLQDGDFSASSKAIRPLLIVQLA